MFSFINSDSVIMASHFLYSFGLNSDQLVEMSVLIDHLVVNTRYLDKR